MNRILDYENLSVKLQSWIKNYVNKYNINSLVIGVSGGIDSAVVSTLFALTGIETIAVGLPINSNINNTELSNKQLSFLKGNSTLIKRWILGINDIDNVNSDYKQYIYSNRIKKVGNHPYNLYILFNNIIDYKLNI
jgi:NH3-dependent NAD+ synthetase